MCFSGSTSVISSKSASVRVGSEAGRKSSTSAGSISCVTSNGSGVDALRFYQRRGFRLLEVRVGAVDDARAALKPAIPRVGMHGIEVHDEIELVRR